MFGIIYTAAGLIGAGVSAIKDAKCDMDFRKDAIERYNNGENPGRLYVDHKGAFRSLDNDNYAELRNDDITGDVWFMEGAPSRRKKNLSEEWRRDYYDKTKAKPKSGQTTVNDITISPYGQRNINSINKKNIDKRYYCLGQWYKDLNNGRLYVIRHVKYWTPQKYCCADFYMDIETREWVRLSDDCASEKKLSKEDINLLKNIWKKQIDGEWRIIWGDSKIEPDHPDYLNYYYLNNNYKGVTENKEAQKELNMMGQLRPHVPYYG